VFSGNIIALLYFKKSASEAHKILVETYRTIICRDWFSLFKNNNFNVEDKERSGAAKKFEELKALLHKDSCQTLTELSKSLGVDHTTVSKHLKVLGII